MSENRGKWKPRRRGNANRGSQSLMNLTAESNYQHARGSSSGRGQRSFQGRQQHATPNPMKSDQFVPQDFPPSYESVVGVNQFNPYQPNPMQQFNPYQPNPMQQFNPYQPNPMQQFYREPNMFMGNVPTGKGAPPSAPPLPFADEPFLRERAQRSTAVSSVNSHHLITELINFPGFSTNVQTLSKFVDKNYDDVLKVIKDKPALFSTLEDKSIKKVMVELCPAVGICKDHLGSSGCSKPSCTFMHICIDYVVHACHKKNCPFGHLWKTNHNDFILHNLCLENIPLCSLKKLMKKVFSETTVLKICFQYHQENCHLGDRCNDLHICYSFVKTLGNCSNDVNCPYNHNVYDSRCKAVLEKFGICMNESPKDIMNIILNRLDGNNVNDFIDNRGSAITAEIRNEIEELRGTDSAKQKETRKDNIDEAKSWTKKKSKEVTEKKERSSKGKSTVFSWQFDGNVDTPLICDMGIDRKCPNVKQGCKFLHCKSDFYWQFGNDDKWYNFHKYHSDILESKFRDVTCDKTLLPKLHPEKVNDDMKGLLSLLGIKSIRADFQSMTINCESPKKVYSIRHLRTASSAVCDSKSSTTFNWYFYDDNGKWELYGNSDASSRSVEKAYQENPNGTTISTNSFKYEMNFGNMTQKNTTTGKIREIKRRPAPFPDKSSIRKFELPKHWESMDDSDVYKLVRLDRENNEYRSIRQLIKLTLPMLDIIAISRVQNIYLWKQLKNKESELDRKYKEDRCLNVQKLFHGIDNTVLADICRDNLDWRLHDRSTTKPYGQGAYFYNSMADAARHSAGCKVMLVADVIIGKIAAGHKNMTRPPGNPLLDTLFDSTTDDNERPTVFVKYNKQEYYPAYIVEF